MVLEQNVTLGNDTVVMVWISSQDAAAVAEKGFRLVHGPSDYFYLVSRDRIFPFGSQLSLFLGLWGRRVARERHRVCSFLSSTSKSPNAALRNSWCDPFKTWQKVAFLSFPRLMFSDAIRSGIFLPALRKSHVLPAISSARRTAIALDGAIFTSESRPHRLASRSCICRSLLVLPTLRGRQRRGAECHSD